MSKLTTAHYEIARWLRWKMPSDEFEVIAVVERYHRADGYRNIYVEGPSIEFLNDLQPKIVEYVKKYDGQPLRITVDKPGRTAKPGEFHLRISIWK